MVFQTLKTIVCMTHLVSLVSSQDIFSGEATFYGGAGSSGSCLLQPLFNGVPITVAMNHEDYRSGEVCGKCVKFWGNGQGSGMTPVIGPYMATIDNECPECKKGDLDLGFQGDGRWKIQWHYIDCQLARDEAEASQHNGQHLLRGRGRQVFS